MEAILEDREAIRVVDVEYQAVDVPDEKLRVVILEEKIAVMYQMVDCRDDVFDALRGTQVDSGCKSTIDPHVFERSDVDRILYLTVSGCSDRHRHPGLHSRELDSVSSSMLAMFSSTDLDFSKLQQVWV